jgi:arginine decarboxylase
MSGIPLQKHQKWSSLDSEELYKVKNWGAGFYGVSDCGEIEVALRDRFSGHPTPVSLAKIIRELKESGIEMPLILRFPDVLARLIEDLHASFETAIKTHAFTGRYRGAFPIKVNQKQEVLEEIVKFGSPFQYGLEVGSKCELLAALGTIRDYDANLVCNGYKDEAYIDMALLATKAGINVALVVEMPSELETIVERAAQLEVTPKLGIRMRLSMRGTGYWGSTSGDSGLFGLNIPQILAAVDKLKALGKIDYLKVLHFHQGSQLCELEGIREATREAARVYAELYREGVPLEFLNLGGGLAVDYEGTNSNSNGSKDYELADYCNALVETVKDVCDEAVVPHPNLITESGRGIAAYYSLLVFNILDVSEFKIPTVEDNFPEDYHVRLTEMLDVAKAVGSEESIPEQQMSQLVMWRAELQQLFSLGDLSIRELATSERIYREGMSALAAKGSKEAQEARPPIDFLYGNFSLFQSLPDHWALQQTFPILPIHRLNERPSRRGVVADLTCDSDGQVKSYVQNESVSDSLPVHDLIPGEDYIFGIFLVGAYQETLGDMHNLFGETHAVSVELVDGEVKLEQRTPGDTVEQVLGYLDFVPKTLTENIQRLAARAMDYGNFNQQESDRLIANYKTQLSGYTYLKPNTK